MDNNNELGKYLKELRGKLSLREVSQRTNSALSHSYIGDLEKGKNARGNPTRPTPDALKILANVYGTSYEKLLKLAGYLDKDVWPTNVGLNPGQPAISHMKLPVYGEIHAGNPTYADENIIGHISISDKFIERYGGIENLFALRIKGDSMSKVVPDGFTAVFVKDSAPEDGDIVAVLLDGDEATIKRYHQTSMAYIFEPDSYNPIYQPITVNKQKADGGYCRILGKYLYATSEGI